jgi:hypothetical protein
LITAALALAPISAVSAASASGAPVSGAACSEPPYRQFDFWIGDWTAYDPGGVDVIAKVSVTRAADGCALLEQVTPTKGAPSVALIAYDPEATLWRWTSVAGDGRIVSLQGGVQNGEMTLEGDQTGASDRSLARIVWKTQGVDVDESGERSKDGKSWAVWFDLDLRRAR